MINKVPWFLKSYLEVILGFASKTLGTCDSTSRRIHILGLTSVATNWLLWAYAFLALIFLPNKPEVALINFLFALGHLFTPVILTVSGNLRLVASVLLTFCMAQQVYLGYHFGGFNENLLVWYGVAPLLGGVLNGLKGLLTWAVAVLTTAMSFVLFEYYGYSFPPELAGAGQVMAAGLTIAGWAVCVSIIITVFILQQEEKERQLKEKTSKINNLLRILTHDVSNSLNVINTASTLYQNYDQSEEKVKYYFEKMDMASSNINEVINCVRTLHSAENDWDPIRLKPSSLLDSVERCARLLEHRLSQKSLVLNMDKASLDCCKVMVDPLFFNNHVLMNVLSNAVKFSNKGGRIDIYAKPLGRKVALVVEDHGVGMTREKLRVLFKEKYNKSTPGTEGEKGTGFGMLILKSFMERFEGNVWVDSRTDGEQGTKVTMLFNRAESIDCADSDHLGLGDFVMKGFKSKKSDHVAGPKEHGGNELSHNLS